MNLTVYTWTLRFANQLNLGLNSHFNHDEQAEFLQLNAMSSSIVLSSDSIDSLGWRCTSSKKFSFKSTSDFLFSDGAISSKLPFLWNLKILLRVKLFLWLAARNKILTADNLLKRGWQGLTICILCKAVGESLQHIMLKCSYSISVWSSLSCPIVTPQTSRSSSSDRIAALW